MTRVCKSLIWNKVSKVCKRRLGTWNTARLAASSPSQNWTTWRRLFRTFVWSSRGGLQLTKAVRGFEPGLLRRTSIVAPQLDLWDLAVRLLRLKVFIWCLQWQRHGRCFCVHWTWVMPSCIAHWELVYMLSWKCRCRLAFHQVKRPTICLKRHWTGYVMLHWHGCSFWHLRLNM